jgi:hypothetical protein
MTGPKNPVDEFRRVTGAALRAIGEKPDVQVSFAPGAAGGGQTGLLGGEARLTAPSRHMPANEVACTRGEADAIALKLRHHNAKTHGKESPRTPLAREIFNAIETARVEAIGAKRMAGVAQNLTAQLEEHCRQKGYARVSARQENNLAEVMRLLVREAVTGQPVPATAKTMVDAWRSELSQQVREDIGQLTDVLGNQRASPRRPGGCCRTCSSRTCRRTRNRIPTRNPRTSRRTSSSPTTSSPKAARRTSRNPASRWKRMPPRPRRPRPRRPTTPRIPTWTWKPAKSSPAAPPSAMSRTSTAAATSPPIAPSPPSSTR